MIVGISSPEKKMGMLSENRTTYAKMKPAAIISISSITIPAVSQPHCCERLRLRMSCSTRKSIFGKILALDF